MKLGDVMGESGALRTHVCLYSFLFAHRRCIRMGYHLRLASSPCWVAAHSGCRGLPFHTRVAAGLPFHTRVAAGLPFHTRVAAGLPFHTRVAAGLPFHRVAAGLPFHTLGLPLGCRFTLLGCRWVAVPHSGCRWVAVLGKDLIVLI